jgi:hypothetical protein
MSKKTLSKSLLKELIKECIHEVLLEGLDPNNRQKNNASAAVARNIQKSKPATVVENHNPRFDKAINEAVSSITDNEIMKSIFMDTAKTTLQEQMKNETPGSGGGHHAHANHLVEQNTNAGISLNGLFGDSVDRWKQMAFDNTKK